MPPGNLSLTNPIMRQRTKVVTTYTINLNERFSGHSKRGLRQKCYWSIQLLYNQKEVYSPETEEVKANVSGRLGSRTYTILTSPLTKHLWLSAYQSSD
jgi:hypothetical protein